MWFLIIPIFPATLRGYHIGVNKEGGYNPARGYRATEFPLKRTKSLINDGRGAIRVIRLPLSITHLIRLSVITFRIVFIPAQILKQ